MKKFLTLLMGIALVYSCSTSSDGNGNSTTDVVPVAPTNLSGSAVSTTQINLSWTDNSTNETGFKIERKTGTGIFTVVGTTTSNVTTYSDTGLTPNTTYIYRVFSYNSSGDSATYSDEEIVITNSTFITDIEGNTYQIITIGNKTWTQNNMNVTKYSDGTPIPQVTDENSWTNMEIGAWCYYNNITTNGITYGKLYNWYAVKGIYDSASASNPALRKKLAPNGWHIPSDTEWTTLIDYLGGLTVAGGKMKSTGAMIWQSPNVGATNESGFSGLPGGGRNINGGTFADIGKNSYWWCSSEKTTTSAWYYILNNGYVNAYRSSNNKKLGFAVRCVKD